MPRHDQTEARNQQKQDLAIQRLKERVLSYITDLKKPTEIISIDELVASLKAKNGEYARVNNKQLERQVQQILDCHFADVNATNIRKQFYKKKDLIKLEDSGEELPNATNEELVEHKSSNALNNMITILGKRPAAPENEGLPEKRRKLSSMASFSKAQMASQAAEEMLNKYLVKPTVNYKDLGGMDDVVK